MRWKAVLIRGYHSAVAAEGLWFVAYVRVWAEIACYMDFRFLIVVLTAMAMVVTWKKLAKEWTEPK